MVNMDEARWGGCYDLRTVLFIILFIAGVGLMLSYPLLTFFMRR